MNHCADCDGPVEKLFICAHCKEPLCYECGIGESGVDVYDIFGYDELEPDTPEFSVCRACIEEEVSYPAFRI